MLADHWAHTYYEDPKALEMIEDEDFDPDEVANIIGAEQPPRAEPPVNDWETLT